MRMKRRRDDGGWNREATNGIVIAHFRRAFGAASETFITDPIQRLTARGIPNQVFTLLSLHPHSPVAHVAMTAAGASRGRAIERRSRRLPSFFSKVDMLGWPIARRWLAGQLRAAAPDILVSHFGPDGCLAAPVARRLGIPHVVRFYGYDVGLTSSTRLSPWPRLYDRLFKTADSLCPNSHYLAQRLSAAGAPDTRLTVIHSGVDMGFFEYRNPAACFDGRTVRLLHVGRLTAKKSPLKLLQAVNAARSLCTGLQLELTIAGDGELAEASRMLAKDLGLADHVRFTGPVSRVEVRELYRTHHVYTQYSETAASGDTEGLPTSCIEASASGLPVVTTRHNGLPEVVLDGVSGLLSDEGDVQGMARNIASLAGATGRWTQMGRAGRRRAEECFSIDTQAQRLLDHCLRVSKADDAG